MAREVLYRRYWQRVRERRRRLEGRGIEVAFESERSTPLFIDYWPEVPATLPEKVLFSILAEIPVNFYFSYHWGDFPFTERRERVRPDFILPDYHIVIEVTGVYWHTREGMFEHDAWRSALFIAAGWRIRSVPDTALLENPYKALEEHVPELMNPMIKGNTIVIGDRPFDPRAALRGRLQRWPRKLYTQYKRRRRVGDKQAILDSFITRRPDKSVPEAIGPLFTEEYFSAEYIAELENYGEEWLKYMNKLRKFFTDATGHPITSRIHRYGELWDYYKKWQNWWDRFTS